MAKQVIRAPDVAGSAAYSQAVKAGPMIYVSGTTGAGATIQEQTRQAIKNCETILRAAGATLQDVVEVQVLLANPKDFAGLNEEYVKCFPAEPPARSVARLGPEIPNVLVSIKMTAFRE